MKTFIKASILLSIFFIITACNVPKTALPSPTIQGVVTPTQISDEEAIRAALAAHLGMNATELRVEIEQNTGTHAKGGVENGYFLAAKVNGEWQIVADGQAMPNCNAVGQYGFPTAMVPECATPTESPAESDAEAIRAALAVHLGADVNELTVVIEQNTGAHAKGGVENGYFLAAKINGQWQIVADGQAMPDCNAVAQYGFPASMVPECSSDNSSISDCPDAGVLAASFIADITYPDGSAVSPGQDFVKTWRIKNVGTCPWNGDYQLVFDRGNVMGGPSSQRLTSINIPPAKTLDISINLTAPQNAGTYIGNWGFRAPNGVIFGLTTGNPIWVEVAVELPGDSIRSALAAHLGANPNDLKVVIAQNTGTHARGGVDNGYFLAAKVNGQWLIVADGQAMPDCTLVTQYSFPLSMVPECHGVNTINEIYFKPGGTSAYIQKTIKAGEQHVYKIRAMANQTMTAGVSSDDQKVFMGITGVQGGQQLLSINNQNSYWTGTLPQTQDYFITLTTDQPELNYWLGVEIPIDIHFEPGATSAVFEGRIELLDASVYGSADTFVTYLLYASAGQTMDITLSSPHMDALSMGVYGKDDGQPYLRWQVKNNGYHGVLPLTQGYYLKVFSNGASTDFTLGISIE